MARSQYFAPITIKDEAGDTYEFRSEIEVKPPPPFAMFTVVKKNGELVAERSWGKVFPMEGQVRNFAERFAKDEKYRKRFLTAPPPPTPEGHNE